MQEQQHDVYETHEQQPVQRRTILVGAAWTVPVMALSVAAPAHAAGSGELTLQFGQPQYTGTACGSITGITVTATRDGAPAVGEMITVTLDDGYTFEDGSTSKILGPTGSDGTIIIPPVSVPSNGGSSAIGANASGTTAQATLSSPTPSGSGAFSTRNGNAPHYSYPGIPADATPVGGYYFLDTTGTLWYGDSIVATGVTSAAGYQSPNNDQYYAQYVTGAPLCG